MLVMSSGKIGSLIHSGAYWMECSFRWQKMAPLGGFGVAPPGPTPVPVAGLSPLPTPVTLPETPAAAPALVGRPPTPPGPPPVPPVPPLSPSGPPSPSPSPGVSPLGTPADRTQKDTRPVFQPRIQTGTKNKVSNHQK